MNLNINLKKNIWMITLKTLYNQYNQLDKKDKKNCNIYDLLYVLPFEIER